MKKTYYLDTTPTVWIFAIVRLLRKKGLIEKGELEEYLALGLKDYEQSKIMSFESKEADQ